MAKIVKARYNGPSDELYFVDGRIYEVRGILRINNGKLYGVVDEVGDCSLCYKDGFTIVEGSEEDLPVIEE